MAHQTSQCRSRCLCGLGLRSEGARMLGSRVRTTRREWMFVCCVSCRKRSLGLADHSCTGVLSGMYVCVCVCVCMCVYVCVFVCVCVCVCVCDVERDGLLCHSRRNFAVCYGLGIFRVQISARQATSANEGFVIFLNYSRKVSKIRPRPLPAIPFPI